MPSVAIRYPANGTDQETLLELRFPARPDRLKLMRGPVHGAARMCGLSDIAAQDTVLAVDEACQNIIVHAYRGRDDGEIVMTLTRRGPGLFVQLRDFGAPTDPAQIRHRALDDIKPGKLGTFFMRSIMDRVEYFSVPSGGNLLQMFKTKDEPE